MLWLHPFIQATALILATYVMYMGINRFRFQHLKQKAAFNWKRHVLLGKMVNWLWLIGWLLGLYMTFTSWGSINLTGGHYVIGTLMVPFIIVSLVTGFILQKPSGKRPGLALTHGVTNGVLYCMALFQSFSGMEVVKLFLLE
ncbi:DUF4079 family protein [Pseudodesulfovibrio sediminis]|uniref:DUF4079 domain-containing protein n=1 Tax=Pseudodesulfovibrio sediminis TaxID=2810563 RepID=A0ABM7P9I6_9BACT|nr:DUF4079 family protein [Pseudodesulfovibrio sediminis]BCS89726.1 hypothetical protein PSDVSF_29680 [Pseudodesulfovibrio sediminis]